MTKRRISGLLAAVALASSAAAVGTATAAHAVTLTCNTGSDWGPGCWTTVTGIDPGSYLAVHNAPDYAHGTRPGREFQFHNGDSLFIYCWATGAPDTDGHRDRYWFAMTEGSIGGGYVNDWYLNTGSYSDWHPHLPHC